MDMARKKVVEELVRASMAARILLFLPLSLLCFYAGKRWAASNERLLLLAGDPSLSPPLGPFAVLANESRHPSDLATDGILISPFSIPTGLLHSPALPPLPSPPPPSRFTGILNEDGTLRQEFSDDEEGDTETDEASEVELLVPAATPAAVQQVAGVVKRYKFQICDSSMQDCIPCLDNAAAIRLLPSTARGEHWERHCPQPESNNPLCLIPAPLTWRAPILWPKSRDEIYYGNVPHTRLVNDKGGQNWITLKKDKFIFPGGGTQFPHGANQYLDQMTKMVPEIAFGVHTRVALDIGCGVASWGAYLLSRNVLTLSIAPKDVHENQIQFALERGVPAMVAALATHRLLYPSQAFDLIHCSRCRIEWTHDEAILLLEVDRILRAGGYFAWAAQPVYKHEANLPELWHEMEDLANRLCWKLVAKEGYIAIWQKPVDNICYYQRAIGTQPPLCAKNEDPDSVWYIPLEACITLLPELTAGKNISDWPARLHIPPYRIQHVIKDAITAKEEVYIAQQHYWNAIVAGYLRGLGLKKEYVRNVMDMKAGYGGFAAALVDQNVDWWVMNVVPVSGQNTLPVIYDRGLIGVVHDWCEAFDTYPRTYDLLHASGLFTQEEKRCNIVHIVVEMDRILRAGGWVLIRETYEMVQKVAAIAKSVRWKTRILNTESGPFGKDKLLSCQKQLWHA